MLASAGNLMLDLCEALLQSNWGPKDATPLNIPPGCGPSAQPTRLTSVRTPSRRTFSGRSAGYETTKLPRESLSRRRRLLALPVPAPWPLAERGLRHTERRSPAEIHAGRAHPLKMSFFASFVAGTAVAAPPNSLMGIECPLRLKIGTA